MGKTQLIIVIIAATISTVSLLAGTLYFVFMYRKRKLESEQEIALMQQQFDSTLLQNTVAIQRETMAQIGQEIHDNVGQKLTLASLYVQQQLMQGNSNTERLSDIATFIDDSLQDLRLLSKTLSNEAYTEAVFSSLIITTCDAVSKLGKCKVLHQIEDIGPLLSASHRQVLLRVLQEFLQNSVRHAQCSLISVECKKTTDSVTLHLQDNGIGFDVTAPPQNGAGIQNMQARVTQIGGKVVLTSSVGKGTSLLVTLNLKNSV